MNFSVNLLLCIIYNFLLQVNQAYSEEQSNTLKKKGQKIQPFSEEESESSHSDKDNKILSKRIGIDVMSVRSTKFYNPDDGPFKGTVNSYFLSYDISRIWAVTAYYSRTKMEKNDNQIATIPIAKAKGESSSFGVLGELRSKPKGFVFYGRAGLAHKKTTYKTEFKSDNIDWFTADGLPAEYDTELDLFGIASAFGCRYVFDQSFLKEFIDPVVSLDLLNIFHPLSAKTKVNDRKHNLSERVVKNLNKDLERQGIMTAQLYFGIQLGVRF